MFAEQIRRAVEASPRVELPKLSSALWKAFAVGGVTEEEASELSALIEAKKAAPAPQKPVQRRVGSRPRNFLTQSNDAAPGPPQGDCRHGSPAGSLWPSKPSWP